MLNNESANTDICVGDIKIPLERINAIYIIFVAILCYTADVPEIAKGFLAIPLYLTIPLAMGKIIALILSKLSKGFIEITEKFDNISNWIFLWGFGIISMVLFALLFNLVGGFVFSIYLMITAIILLGLLEPLSPVKMYKQLNMSSRENVAIILSGLAGLIAVLYISQYSPYPLMAESDQFRHNLAIVNMVKYNKLYFFPSYIPTFHVLLSFPLILLNSYSDSYSFFWGARFLLYPLYTIGIYLFSYQISKSVQLSILAAFISLFIAHPEFDRYIFAPKGVIYILVPFLFYIIDKNLVNDLCHKKDFLKLSGFIAITSVALFSLIFIYQKIYLITEYSRLFLPITIPIFIFIAFSLIVSNKIIINGQLRFNLFIFLNVLLLLLIHLQMGMSVVFFITLYIAASIGLKEYRRPTYILICFVTLITLMFILAQKYAIVNFETSINLSGIQSYFDATDFPYKYILIKRFFSEFVLTVFLFGIVYTVLYRSLKNIPLMLVGSSVFFIYFLPIPFSSRIMITATPIVSYFAAYGIIKCRHIFMEKYKNILYFALLISILTPAIMTPYAVPINWFKAQEGSNYYSYYEPYEYETAKWIQNNMPVADTYILSDPLTHFLITGIADTNEIVGMAGNMEGQHDAVADILSANNSTNIVNNIDKFMQNGWYVYPGYRFDQSEFNPDESKNKNVLVVITGRTQYWLEQRKEGVAYTENVAHNFNNMEYLNRFNNSEFTLIYKVDGKIYVYQLNRGDNL